MKKPAIFGSLAGAIIAILLALGIIKPPVINPSPTPTPTATATPEASPTSFPTPSPAATPEPPVDIPPCTLPPMEGDIGICVDNPQSVPMYQQAVESAVWKVSTNRGLIDANGIVINEGAYTAEVARQLRLNGYCATNGLLDEVWIKRETNSFSEHWDLVTRNQESWVHFAARCAPAKF